MIPRRGHARRFLSRREGIAAVEFALVVPVLLLLYMGSFDLTRGLVLDQKLSQAAGTIADLATRNRKIDRGQLDTILDIGTAILAPYPAEDLRVRFSSVSLNGPDEEPTLEWWYSPTADRPTRQDLQKLRDSQGRGVVLLVETWSIYRPLRGLVFDAPVDLEASALARARLSASLECPDCPT